MKKWKKVMALLAAALMMLMAAVPAAADTTKALTGTPSASDTGTLTITGLKAGDTVKWYPIAKAKYDNGFTGYETVVAGKPADVTAPTADEVTALANDAAILAQTPFTATADEKGTAAVTVPVGEYVAVVTSGEPSRIYNPMLGSVYYTTDGQSMSEGSVDAGSKYSINGSSAYAKSSDETSGKKVDPGTSATTPSDNGEDAAIGDTLNFELTGRIPSYSSQYTKLTYQISDQMDPGLDLKDGSVKVQVGGQPVTAGDNTFTLTVTDGQNFTVAFVESYIRGLASKSDTERAVTVTYSAKLNEKATVNFDANNNKATFTYTNKPDGSTTSEKHETHQYTFAIDGNINGSKTKVNRKGHELIKVNEKGEPETVGWVDDGTEETTVATGLAGAEFTLTNEATGKSYTAKTDGNGYFNGFTGLDAGTYTLVETKAPEGYSLNTAEHKVVITATYNADGTLKDYEITIDGQNTSHYQATYKSGEVTEIKTIGEPETTFIKNTKLNALPSTGGTGTYLFTGIGAAAVAAALALYFRSKKSRKHLSE